MVSTRVAIRYTFLQTFCILHICPVEDPIRTVEIPGRAGIQLNCISIIMPDYNTVYFLHFDHLEHFWQFYDLAILRGSMVIF